MTRVHERHAQPGTSGTVGAVHHKRAEPKKKPSYKVVLEEVAGRKRLKTVLSTKQQAPPGYTFIPAGDPQLTSRCKKIAKDEQLTVFIVSTSKFPHERMSTEVHRVGYHFPSTTVDQACMSLGVTLTAQGRVLQSNFAFIDDQAVVDRHQGRRLPKGLPKGKQKRRGRNASPSFDINLSQAVIDTQAREAIKDLFPNIPPDDLHTIIGRAFQKGNGLVGTVSDLSLVRRAQLAVVAHIRHVYTNYDRLLRIMKWFDARSEVQQACLEVLVQWRGDDEANGEIDDILREVIVIPDDDDEKDEILRHGANLLEGQHDRSNSVELISADELDTQTINYANTKLATNVARSPSVESDDGQVQYLGAAPLPYGRPVQYNQQRLERMGAQRHKLWEEAINRRRKNPEIHYAVDNRAELPALGMIGEGQVPTPPQRLNDPERQPYLFEAAGHNSAPMPTFSRLIPLPRSEGQANYRIESYSGEKSGFTEQVSYPAQPHQPSRVARDEAPTIAYYTNEPSTRHPVSHLYESRQPLNGPQDEDKRFVQVRDFGREMQNASNPHLYESSPRRHSEMMLPSIEGKFPIGREQQQPMSPGRHQKMNPFAQRHANTWEMPRQAIPSVAHLSDEEQPQMKRRKINDQQPLDDHRQRTVLVPLGQAEGHGYIHPRPPEPVYHEDMLPFALDKRIIQLPPREKRRYEDSQGPIQVIPQFQSRLVKPEDYGKPQSPTRSVAIQPLYDHQSPISLRGSQAAPSYSEVLEPQPSSRHTHGVVGGDGQMFSDSQAIREPPRQIGEAWGEMRTEFRNLAISSRQGGDHDSSTNKHAWGRREVHYSSQASSAAHMPVNHQAQIYKVDFEEQRQPAPSSIHSESRDVQRPPFIQGGPYGSGGQRMPTGVQYIPQHAEVLRADPSKRRPSLPVSRPAGVKWSGLHQSTNTFEPTNAIAFRSHETPEWEVMQNKSVNNGLRHNGTHIGLAANENKRRAAQLRRKMPDEVVVLE